MSIGQCVDYELDYVFDANWLSCTVGSHPALPKSEHWISYDFGAVRRIDNTHIWNYNVAGGTDAGIQHIRTFTSIDGVNWTDQGVDTIPIASGLVDYEGVAGPDFQQTPARYFLMAAIKTHGGTCAGFSEIQINFSETDCIFSEVEVSITQDICEEVTRSTVLLEPIDGIAPFSYYWSTGANTAEVVELDTGSYSVQIIDAVGCSRLIEFRLDNERGDPLFIHEDPIPAGIYFVMDTLRSSGKVKNQMDVSFIYSSFGELQSNFEVDNDTEFSMSYIDCDQAVTPQYQSYGYNTPGTSVLFYKHYIGNGNDHQITVNTSNDFGGEIGENTLSGLGDLDNTAAARFLSQATLGYDIEMITEVQDLGIEEWLEWQFCLPSKSYTNHLKNIPRFNQPGIHYWLNFHRSWWHNTLTEDDYLRDRIAFALSEIFVISSHSFLQNYADGMTSYYDLLLSHSFGNYRDLLLDISLHPTMGFYLSHINNPRTDTTINLFPDENYAREILQLFSIGLYELNLDGTRKKDSLGIDIPTYNNDDIIEFAKLFTGLGFNSRPFGTPIDQPVGLPFTASLSMNEEQHEPGEKHLLNGLIVPGGQTGMQDINAAIDNIFNHPNVGPFISSKLIQRLIKSEPSPAFVSRVASVFNDNGSGVRGDLKEVIRAIFLDPEARDCSWITDPTHGMLREPIVRMAHLMKAFNISNTTNTFYALGFSIEDFTFQAPLRAPSVFNFFQTDYSAPGLLKDQSIRSPEFQILDAFSSIGYVNLVDSISMNQGVLDVEDGLAILNFDDEMAVGGSNEDLINLLDQKLTYGNLSQGTRDILYFSLDQLDGSIPDRVRMAIYLIANSPDFVILK